MLKCQTPVEKAILFMKQHLSERVTLDQIAQAAGYSKYHLERLFRRETGHTAYQYLQRLRLTEAARKLVETKRPIAEIAFETGYESQAAFTSMFKRFYAVTPHAYRVRGRFVPLLTYGFAPMPRISGRLAA